MPPDLLSLGLDQVLSFRDFNRHYDSPADLIYQRFTTERKVETHILSVIENRSANEYHWLRLFVREGDNLIISLIHRVGTIAYPLGFFSYSRRKVGLHGRLDFWVVSGNGIDWFMIDVFESEAKTKNFECLVEDSIRLSCVPIVECPSKLNKAFSAKLGGWL